MRRATFTVTQSIVISLLVSTASVAIYRLAFGGPPEPRIVVVEAPRPVVAPLPAAPPPPTEVVLDCPAPAERPAPHRSWQDDPHAKAMFSEAVDQLRSRRYDEGCALLGRIVEEKPDTIWAAKARDLSGRRCHE